MEMAALVAEQVAEQVLDCIGQGGDLLGLAELAVAPWDITGAGCVGQFSETTSTHRKGYVGMFGPVVFWDTKSDITITIDYSIDCDVGFQTSVTGFGNAVRRVGIEYASSTASYDPVVGWTTFSSDTEDAVQCKYVLGGCTVTYELSHGGVHETQLRVTSIPDVRCFTYGALTAYNRADYPDPLKVTETTASIPGMNPDTGCPMSVPISWTKVDKISMPQFELVNRL